MTKLNGNKKDSPKTERSFCLRAKLCHPEIYTEDVLAKIRTIKRAKTGRSFEMKVRQIKFPYKKCPLIGFQVSSNRSQVCILKRKLGHV